MPDDLRLARIERALEAKGARDREWQALAMSRLLGIQGLQRDHEVDIKSLKSARWVATALRSAAPSWIAAAALVGILFVAATLAWAR